jgi:hypothetical protein
MAVEVRRGRPAWSQPSPRWVYMQPTVIICRPSISISDAREGTATPTQLSPCRVSLDGLDDL